MHGTLLPMPRLLAILLDIVCVFVFALVGRASHAEATDPAGVLRTAAPFLLATLMAWVYLVLKNPTEVLLRQGLIVWGTALVLGMTFRVMLGDGVQVAFVVVAALALAVLLLGWRLLATLVTRRRAA